MVVLLLPAAYINGACGSVEGGGAVWAPVFCPVVHGWIILVLSQASLCFPPPLSVCSLYLLWPVTNSVSTLPCRLCTLTSSTGTSASGALRFESLTAATCISCSAAAATLITVHSSYCTATLLFCHATLCAALLGAMNTAVPYYFSLRSLSLILN